MLNFSHNLLTIMFKNSFPQSDSKHDGAPNVQMRVVKWAAISAADLVLRGNAHANFVRYSTTPSIEQ
jgi:hypothetical protein